MFARTLEKLPKYLETFVISYIKATFTEYMVELDYVLICKIIFIDISFHIFQQS